MFFYIGNHCELLEYADAGLFLDKGWMHQDSVWFKGYSTECNLSENIDAIVDGYQPRGIWALIHKTQTGYTAHHSELRGFPLFKNNDNEFTNIPNLNGFELEYCHIDWSTDFTELSLEEVVDRVASILLENVEGVIKYNPIDRMVVLATGGLDSTLVWGIIDSITEYDLVRTSSRKHRAYDSPLVQYMNSNHWSYNVINLKSTTNWNLTGFSAEAMTIRRPDMLNTICRFNNTTVYDVIDNEDYMYHFLHRPNWKNMFEEQHLVVSNLRESLLSHINVDYYMWHIDNNFHVSPFYDKRIAETCIRLNMQDLIDNCKNGIVERLVLQKIRPSFIALVSEYKNYGQVLDNFDNNFSTIKLRDNINVTLKTNLIL